MFVAMRLSLLLSIEGTGRLLPASYQYPLSSAIYKIIGRVDSEYATFLHEHGYRKENSLKAFKLFTFSDIGTPFENNGDRLLLKGADARLTVCFHIPEAADNFVRGIFLGQDIEVADSRSKVVFHVRQVEVLRPWDSDAQPDESKEATLQPASPIVVGITNDEGKYNFLYPGDARYAPALLHHLTEKYRVVYGDEAADNDFRKVEVTVINAGMAKSRLITIKAGTSAETQIRGFTKFRLRVKGPARVIDLAMNVGVGIYTSQGFGCVNVISA
jgi:CRISPR-associated endoribonuclease Cas6